MLLFESVSESVQPPFAIFPFSDSPLISPVLVTGSSLLMRPNEVCVDKLYPAPSGT